MNVRHRVYISGKYANKLFLGICDDVLEEMPDIIEINSHRMGCNQGFFEKKVYSFCPQINYHMRSKYL